MAKREPNITPLKTAGPFTLGRQSGGYVVRDARTGSVAWYTDKATALRVLNTKLANLRHDGAARQAPAPTAAPIAAPTAEPPAASSAEAAYLYALKVANAWVCHSGEWEDRRPGH